MIVNQQANDVALALFHVGMLEQMRSLSPKTNMDAILRTELGAGFASTWIPPSGGHLAYYAGGNSDRVIVYADGVRTQSESDAFLNGYAPRLGLVVPQDVQIWIVNELNYLLGQLTSAHLPASEYLDMVGYSAGGAVMTAFKLRNVQAQSTQKSKLITFGSPRAGGSVVRDTLANSPIARWMMTGDPIPLIPLRLQDAPGIAAFTGVPTLVQWSQTVHPHGGINLNPDGTSEPSIVPILAAANPITSVLAWAWQAENDPTNQHGLIAYRSALQNAVNLLPNPAQQVVPEGPAETPARQDRVEANRERERVGNLIAQIGHNQNASPVVTPEATLFKPIRIGKIWYVQFGDEIVFTAPIEKRARHIARAGNDFLRSFQKQAVVDPDTLVDQMQLFLQLASDPASGFSPQINTSIQ